MFKVNRLTDYAASIICEVAINKDKVLSANSISKSTNIAGSTVAKLLKTLLKHKILESFRGNSGGYRLVASPDQISVYDIMLAVEGSVFLTSCNDIGNRDCEYINICKVKKGWGKLNNSIVNILKDFKVKDFMH